MEAITVEIPEFATFTEAAQWVADELRARGAESFQWDDRIRYKLPSGAKVEATTLTKSAIAVMPGQETPTGRGNRHPHWRPGRPRSPPRSADPQTWGARHTGGRQRGHTAPHQKGH